MKIAIWGTGENGRIAYNKLSEAGNPPLFFVDSYITKNSNRETLFDIPIISPKEIDNIDTLLLAFSGAEKSARAFLQNNKGKRMEIGILSPHILKTNFSFDSNLLKDRHIVWIESIDKPYLNQLQVNLEDDCNLNCKGCSHYANLFPKDSHLNYESFCKDLKKLSENLFIMNFQMLGGEPLLNKDIVEYMKAVRKHLPITNIFIVSNGLLICKQNEAFFEACKKYDINFTITGYRPTINILDEIKHILNDHGINYNIIEDQFSFGKNLDLEGGADPKIAYRNCRQSNCHFIRDGKLYKCPFSALANTLFNHYDLPIRFNGGIDIYDKDLVWKDVAYDLEEKCIDECRYCGPEETFSWEVQSNPEIADWIINKNDMVGNAFV